MPNKSVPIGKSLKMNNRTGMFNWQTRVIRVGSTEEMFLFRFLCARTWGYGKTLTYSHTWSSLYYLGLLAVPTGKTTYISFSSFARPYKWFLLILRGNIPLHPVWWNNGPKQTVKDTSHSLCINLSAHYTHWGSIFFWCRVRSNKI